MALAPLDLLLSDPPTRRGTIALSEGNDPRIIEGAIAAQAAGIADIILVGDAAKIHTTLTGHGTEIRVDDPSDSPLTGQFAPFFHELRKHKGVSPEDARRAVMDPLVYAAMLVRLGHADGTIGGAISATSDIVRTALQVIGKAPEAKLVSSFFLMLPPDLHTDGRAMVFTDCGLVIDPNPEELASIAAAGAQSCRSLLNEEPKVALLSFSTKGSASHGAVTKVSDALAMLQSEHPDLTVDGELQFDAAFVPSVAAAKAEGSDVAGQANVMVFPNLDAGNMGYKIAQRIGGYTAIGPILQGLAQPANDLSRGCTADDVTQMIAVTILQANAIGRK